MDTVLGEIRLFAGDYAPQGWVLCTGQLLQISQYQALYSLIGTTYGGDGRTTFGVPDLRGRAPMGQGTGVANQQPLTARVIGQKGGVSEVQIQDANMPPHSHTLSASNIGGTTGTIVSGLSLAATGTAVRYVPPTVVPAPTTANMLKSAISVAEGGTRAHSNVMPFLAIQFIMATVGAYPVRP